MLSILAGVVKTLNTGKSVVCIIFVIKLTQLFHVFREMEVFPKFHSVPFSKILTFFRKGPFVLTARYSDPDVAHIHRADSVAQFHVQGVKPSAQGEAQKVKVKVRLNLHGVFQVVSATLMEKQVCNRLRIYLQRKVCNFV